LVAAGAPAAIIGPEGDAYARDLLGGGQPGLRRLALLPAAAALDAAPPPPGAPQLPAGASLADALSLMAETGCDCVGVAGHAGSLPLAAVLRNGR
jgi:osmoprotectant transport system ATP-binding protein